LREGRKNIHTALSQQTTKKEGGCSPRKGENISFKSDWKGRKIRTDENAEEESQSCAFSNASQGSLGEIVCL